MDLTDKDRLEFLLELDASDLEVDAWEAKFLDSNLKWLEGYVAAPSVPGRRSLKANAKESAELFSEGQRRAIDMMVERYDGRL